MASFIHDPLIYNKISAEAFLNILFKTINKPKSVIDVGCGLGTWLAVFKENGVEDIIGIDGDYVNYSLLAIPKDNFIAHDISRPYSSPIKYDLAICLEVAEHLPETSSETIVDTLCGLSDTILFSAALPFQGGQNHINEQPFMYWVEKFNKKGYLVKDLFRQAIWDNDKIEWWYRQNMFLIEKNTKPTLDQSPIYDYYHPELYLLVHNREQELTNLKEQISNSYYNPTIFQAVKTLAKSLFKPFRQN